MRSKKSGQLLVDSLDKVGFVADDESVSDAKVVSVFEILTKEYLNRLLLFLAFVFACAIILGVVFLCVFFCLLAECEFV